MTREETSSILENIDRRVCDDELSEALDMAVKALEQIKALSKELREVRESITDEKVLIGYNMAIAICNKYLGKESE